MHQIKNSFSFQMVFERLEHNIIIYYFCMLSDMFSIDLLNEIRTTWYLLVAGLLSLYLYYRYVNRHNYYCRMLLKITKK